MRNRTGAFVLVLVLEKWAVAGECWSTAPSLKPQFASRVQPTDCGVKDTR
jgi:hypothetical protein